MHMIVHVSHGHCVGLCKSHHGTYLQRVCTVYNHVYSMLLVQGNPIPRMLAEYRLYTQKFWVLSTIMF